MKSDKMPTLFLTLGLPASGKTYFTERLATDEHIFLLNCDLLRLALIETPKFTAAEHQYVFSVADFIVEQHLKQCQSVIYGANANRIENRLAWVERARASEQKYSVVTIWVKTPLEVVKERIAKRTHEIPPEKRVHTAEELLAIMQKNLQAPTPEEHAIEIDGTLPYHEQRLQFDEQFRQLHN